MGDPGNRQTRQEGTRTASARLVRAPGVRAAEAWLLAELERALGTASVAELARPVRVVVPSQSLRVHLAGRIVAFRGRAALGLRIQTLEGLAREIVEHAGLTLQDPALFPIVARREARREPALAEGLEPLADGYAAVLGALDDLLDAGFEAAHAEALAEHLSAQSGAPGVRARARAILDVATRLAAALDRGDAGHRSRLVVCARECLERDPTCLPARSVLLHGFADATGVQADLVAALLRQHAARVVLDAPPDPTASGAVPAAPRFGAGFRERLAAVAGRPVAVGEVAEPARVRLLCAPGRSAEVRAIACRLRERLDAGAEPERLAVVARDLAPYRVALRVHLRRQGVPFSGIGEPGSAGALRRRLNALLALLDPGDTAPMEAWLEARADVEPNECADLRRAFHQRGTLRLDEVARFADWPVGSPLELDVPRRLDEGRDARPPYVARRALAGTSLVAAGRAAAALRRRLSEAPARAPLHRHVRWLSALVQRELAWPAGSSARESLDALTDSLPGPPEVESDEFLWLMRRGLERAGLSALGGAGGGVQVLSVMEARARSFDELFLIGMSRGSFPRTIAEDALLPDAVRGRLRELLPGLPVKREGFDEERFLFAQLLSAAPAVTLSWSDTNDDGRPQPKSPLLDALERGGRPLESERVAPLHAPGAAAHALAGGERALLAGLHGDRADFERMLGAALAELAPDPVDSGRVLAARLAVLDEIDAGPARRHLLGPYFGFVGAVREPADPRRAPLFVTRLEDVARCPWQAFLSRLLRLAPPPDAASELPPASDPRWVGDVVHRVLERIARSAALDGASPVGLDGVDAARAAEPRRPVWPDEATLDAWTLAAAEQELRDEASALPGYERVLARQALPALERARACDWTPAPPSVVATELPGCASLRDASGREREIRFRADRVDRVDGHLVLTDYKTGRPIAQQRAAARRTEALCRSIAEGRSLQAVLYARASGPGAQGRYLFLREDVPEEARSLCAGDAPPFAEPFDAALRALLSAWDRGSFLPRLRADDRDEEPGACRRCQVKDACLRGDSGARLRLEHWFEQGEGRRDAPEQAAVAAFAIGTEQA